MDFRALFMGVSFALMWASAFTSARIIVTAAPPLTALSLRFLISGLVSVGIALALGQNWNLSRRQWRALVVFGISQNALYLGLNFIAMQWIEASLAAIIASTMPLLVAFAAWVFLGERLRPLGIIGLVTGTLGVALIMGARLSGGGDVIGIALCVLAALALTFATLMVRGAISGGNVLMIVGLQMLVGSAALAGFALTTESWNVQYSWRLLAAFLYTTLVPGVLATWVWFQLVQRIGAVRAATFHFLTPFFGVAVAALLLDEQLRRFDMLGVAIVAAGILAVQLSKQIR